MLIGSALLLAALVSLDTLASGFAYGASNTRVPFSYVALINFICSICLGVALFSGWFMGQIVSPVVTVWLSFGVLVALGVYKIFCYFRKRSVRRSGEAQQITLAETIILSVGLSVDGIALGVGISISKVRFSFCLAVFCFSLVTDLIFFMLGHLAGSGLTKKKPLDFSWLSGLVLIAIAVGKLFI